MQATSSIKPAPAAIVAGQRTPQPQALQRGPMGSLQRWAVAGLAVLGIAFALAQAGADDSPLTQQLQAYQQRVIAAAAAPDGAAPADALARRYLGALQPELRHRITDQVRAEQSAGVTPAGNDAFVMRRLELYEAALQQTRTVAASRGL